MSWRGITVVRKIDDKDLRHCGSWVGGHFRTFAQIAPLILLGGVTRKNLHRCLLAGCTLFKLVYRRPTQLCLDDYVALLHQSVDEFLLTAKYACSLIFKKYKIHLLLHLPDHARRYTSLPDVSTEVEESMNALFRGLYKASSGRKDIESNYIALEMAFRDDYNHYLQGGYVPDPDNGYLKLPSSSPYFGISDSEESKESNNHSVPVIGDYVYCLNRLRGWHARVSEVAGDMAKVCVYKIKRTASG